MLPSLLLGGALALGQPPAPVTSAVPPPDPLGVLRGAVGLQPTVQPPAAPAPTVTIEVPPAPAQLVPGASAPAPDRSPLMRALQGTWYGAVLDDNRLAVSGWESMTFTASTDRNQQLPMGFNYLANQFTLQQSWLRLERVIDPNATEPTWGFRSDTGLVGIDYRFTLARGLLDHQLTANNGQPNRYGIDPVQFYGELYLPNVGAGLDVKVGRFFAQFGVESIDTTQNAVYSRAYNFIYNPFTNTGLLTTLKFNDTWSVQNGLVTGSDVFIAPEANLTYLGSVKWAPPTGSDSLLVSVIVGKGRYNAARAFSNPELLDVFYVHKFSDRLTYTADATYSFQTGFPSVGFVNNWAVVQYLTYRLTPRLSATTRLELFDDVQGQRTGFKGLYTAVTTGFTYKPVPNLWFRPEVRFDDNSESRPYEGKPNLFTAALNMMIRW
jgi:hypothetical protein